MSVGKRVVRITVIVVILCVVAMGALYAYIDGDDAGPEFLQLMSQG